MLCLISRRTRGRRRHRCSRGERVVAGAGTSGAAHRRRRPSRRRLPRVHRQSCSQRPSRRRLRRSSLCRPPTGHVFTDSRGSTGVPPTVSEGEGEGEGVEAPPLGVRRRLRPLRRRRNSSPFEGTTAPSLLPSSPQQVPLPAQPPSPPPPPPSPWPLPLHARAHHGAPPRHPHWPPWPLPLPPTALAPGARARAPSRASSVCI